MNDDKAAANWTRHRETVQRVGQFVLKARLSSGGMFGLRGEMRWEQHADGRFEARISGPLGIGALTIAGTGSDVEVRTKKGTYRTDDPDKWIREKMGWTIPIHGLRYWVLGVPSPHSQADLELTRDGQVAVLQQDGWRLDYTEYQDAGGLRLPRKIEIANPEIKIKLVADQWDQLPTQVAQR